MSETKKEQKHILRMDEVGIDDVALVGGKNASLGEMLRELSQKGVKIPSGCVVTAEAYRFFIKEAGLEAHIRDTLSDLDHTNVNDLAKRGASIREEIHNAKIPEVLAKEIERGYRAMEEEYGENIDVAVRSSATAEDLPGASFAGEHETYLGIRGAEDVLTATKHAFASLFTNRAISYRVDKGFDHLSIALSVTIQRMVRSDLGASGVMFSLDTESGFPDVILVNATYGLGELIVQGQVIPDEYLIAKQKLNSAPLPIIDKLLGAKASKMIYADGKDGIRPVEVVDTSEEDRNRFALSEDQVLTLAKWALIVEEHYSAKRGTWTPMDMEWALDGNSNELFMVQARPETVQVSKDRNKIKEYIRTQDGEVLVRGISVGSKIASGRAHVILDPKDIDKFKEGEVLITDMTDPDWEPIMKIASAIVTDKGGRTSHAAIVSRELGISAVVGSGNATEVIKTEDSVTVDTTSTEGLVFKGELSFDVNEHDVSSIPTTKTEIMMNIGTPDTAFEKSFLPNSGVGLAREEFIIASDVGVHPLALIHYDELDDDLKHEIDYKTYGWEDRVKYYVDKLSYGIAKIATAMYPKPVIVRFSDFKTNEYRSLLGGEKYEPEEENPMIGWRGASRYYDLKFKPAFLLECRAIRNVHENMGLDNVIPMVPFCRTVEEGRKTLEVMTEAGVHSSLVGRPGKNDGITTKVYVMCEIPSNIVLADQFLEIFDGMSIGSNDLTQLTLGLDRDSGVVSHVANEKDPAVKSLVSQIIKTCRAKGKYIGICGQAPSDHIDFATFLVEEGIESMSLTPDTVIKTIMAVAEVEKKLGK